MNTARDDRKQRSGRPTPAVHADPETEEINKSIMRILRLKKPAARPQATGTATPAFDSVIRRGLPYPKVRLVKTALDLTDKELAALLGMSTRTLQRKRDSRGKLTLAQGDRLFRIARIFAIAISVLEDEEMARRWLYREQRGLGGRTPMNLIRTESGAHEVEDLLWRIEHGVLA